jgi:hypothetical protein
VLLVMALVVLIGSAAGWYLGEWLTRRTSRDSGTAPTTGAIKMTHAQQNAIFNASHIEIANPAKQPSRTSFDHLVGARIYFIYRTATLA